MNKYIRLLFLGIIDIVLVNIGFYGALYLRFDGQIPANYLESYGELVLPFTVILIASFFLLGLYNRLWQYASIGELVSVIMAVTLGTVINIALLYFIMQGGQLPLPRSILPISWLLNIFLIGGSRLLWRLVRDYGLKPIQQSDGRPVLIVGAGATGVLVAKELKRHYNGEINLIGFVDDDLQRKIRRF